MTPKADGQRGFQSTGHGYDEAAAAAAAAAAPYGGNQPAHAAWGAPQQPTSSMRLVLVGRDGREGEAFPIPVAGIEIGREGAIAFPSDPFVSPQHAKLTPIDGGVHLADLGSRNGVYLRLTEPTPVYPGDLFLLGNQLLRLDRLEAPWQEQPLDPNGVRGFGSPVKPPWAVLVRICVGDIEDDRYHLRGTEMTIGREQGEIVFPSDGFLSRAHARVRMDVHDNAMTVMLEDLGSANGTYLRIRGAMNVPYGAMFRIGDQIFRLRHD
jgi:pSer/pThr/pTyr-binding forkhead associated (FHA) protein